MGGMKTARTIALVGFSLLVTGWSSAAFGDDIEVGSRAPGFSLAGTDGNTYSLSQFAGKQGVVLALVPEGLYSGLKPRSRVAA